MPSAECYAKQKERGGAEFMRKEAERFKIYRQKYRVEWNARRRVNFRQLICRMKQQAKRRNYEYGLSDDDARALVLAPCTYCGVKTEPFNTVDRLNNALGYKAGNVVPCCKTCNMAKGCLDPATYIDRCKHVSFFHTGEGELYDTIWHDTRHKSVTINIYKRVARTKKLEYALTDKEFEELTTGHCVYCDRPTTKTHKNGIDRLDSSKGYVADNCVTCCGQCNIAKKKLSLDDFIMHANKVANTKHPSFARMPRCTNIITPRCKTVK